MKATEKIKSVIKADLQEFNQNFGKTMKSNVPLLNIVTKYLLRRKGKQIRPILVFLSAKTIAAPNDATHVAASLIELLHTATLVHDDVVDDAMERRGFLSINALWRSKIAVLLGDFLLAKGLLLSVEHKQYELLEIVSEAVKEMSEGELLQIQKTRKLNITEEEYFNIITKKTATLLAACTASGARSVSEDHSVVEKMKQLGLNLGIAFQIKDDLFDYETSAVIGKPKGNDIKEKKLTLPLIAALENAPGKERKEIIRMINKKSSKRNTYDTIFKFAHKYNGVQYAQDKMHFYKQSALDVLADFPESEAKKSLADLINYIVSRKK
ncbi:MAG TPA: polyprenyl synthetase [Bacteroidales bacterium]|jgi:octaprenyl-diphosphate synthase|nr:polyprenyl synthetase [Bacteroidales bacterium]